MVVRKGYARAQSNLGVAYRKVNRYDEAIEALRSAERIQRNFYMVHFHLAGVQKQLALESTGTERIAQGEERFRVLEFLQSHTPAS